MYNVWSTLYMNGRVVEVAGKCGVVQDVVSLRVERVLVFILLNSTVHANSTDTPVWIGGESNMADRERGIV